MTGEQHRLAYHQHLVPVTSPSEAGDRCDDDDATQPPPGLCLLRCCVRLFTTTVARLSLPPSCDDPPIYLRTSFRLHKRKMSDFLADDYDNSSADATLRMLLPLAAASTTIAADGFPRPHTHICCRWDKGHCMHCPPVSQTDWSSYPSNWSLFSHLWVQGTLVLFLHR